MPPPPSKKHLLLTIITATIIILPMANHIRLRTRPASSINLSQIQRNLLDSRWHGGFFISNENTLYQWGDLGSLTPICRYTAWYYGGNWALNLNYRETPVPVIEDVASISYGIMHGYVIKTDGSLWAWGDNWNGLRLGGSRLSYAVRPIHVMDNVMAVSCSLSHTMAIAEGNYLYAWGHNVNGQLGDGTTINRRYPVRVMENVAQVSVGMAHTMAIKKDGSLWAWGANHNGILGDGTGINRHYPVHIMDNVAHVATDGSSSFAVTTCGSLWAWGGNTWGALGIGNTQQMHLPVHVMDDVVYATLHHATSFAIRADGSLWRWGILDTLGLSHTVYSTVPVHMLDNVVAVGSRNMAIKTCGTLVSVGYEQVTTIAHNAYTPSHIWEAGTPLTPIVIRETFHLPEIIFEFTGHPIIGTWPYIEGMERSSTLVFYPNGNGRRVHHSGYTPFYWTIDGNQLLKGRWAPNTTVYYFEIDHHTLTLVTPGTGFTQTYIFEPPK